MGGEDFGRNLEGTGKIPLFFPPDPVDLRIFSEPCQLPLGILAGAELHFGNSLLHADAALRHAEKLLIADGLHGSGIGRDAGGEQALHQV